MKQRVELAKVSPFQLSRKTLNTLAALTIIFDIMNAKAQLLQDPFLDALRKEHVRVIVYLVNGIKLQGQIE